MDDLSVEHAAKIGALADALGLPGDASPEAVAQAVVAGPGSAAVAQQVEAREAPAVLAELNTRLADVQDARAMAGKTLDAGSGIAWSPTVISSIVILGFAGFPYLAISAAPGSAEREVILYLLGAWQSLATAAVTYWLGSSVGSKDKDAALVSLLRGRGR